MSKPDNPDNPTLLDERSVLGSVLISCEPIPPVVELLSPGDFADAKHAAIWSAMLTLSERKEPIDLVTVNHELEAQKLGPMGSWWSLLVALSQESVTSANVGHYARLVRKDARRRDCCMVMGASLHEASTPGVDGDEIIARVSLELGRLAENRALIRPVPMRELVRDEIKAMEERLKTGAVAGVPTGFPSLDAAMGGLFAGGLTLIAARPSMGKSALATGIMANIAIRGGAGDALLFSLEMTREEQAQRLLAAEGRVDLNRIRTGRLGEFDHGRLAEAANRLYTDKLAVVDKAAITIPELRSVARQYASRRPLSVIGVDYVQLVTGQGETREQEVASISRGLKALAMELRVPVIALSQLNRGVESRSDKRPMLSDLRESGSLEQDADQVLLIYRDDYYNPENSKEPGIAEIGVAKNRNGPTGSTKLRWVGKCTRFEPLDAREMAA